MAKKKVKVVTGDWREAEDVVSQLLHTMRKFGLKVYDLGKGSDTFTFVISDKKLSKSDLKSYVMM